MRKKFISLVLALVMYLGLAVPAMAAEVSNGVCTYELSNDPIGTTEIQESLGWDENENQVFRTLTVYIVPDNTTVISKTAPNGRLPYHVYDFTYKEFINPDKFVNAGESFAVIPTYGDISPVAYRFYSEDLNSEDYDEYFPWATLDSEVGGICVMAESAAKTAGVTVEANTPGTTTTPTTPSTGFTAPATGFTDVSADSYYAAPVAWAVEKGITTGTTATTFNPDGICNRGQAEEEVVY